MRFRLEGLRPHGDNNSVVGVACFKEQHGVYVKGGDRLSMSGVKEEGATHYRVAPYNTHGWILSFMRIFVTD